MVSSKAALLGAALVAGMSSCEGSDASNGQEDVPVLQNAPDSGELSTAGAVLRWSRENGSLSYRLLYEAPSACYSAGDVDASVGEQDNAVRISANVLFRDAVCAQAITVVAFEGEVPVEGPFGIGAAINGVSGPGLITLPVKAE